MLICEGAAPTGAVTNTSELGAVSSVPTCESSTLSPSRTVPTLIKNNRAATCELKQSGYRGSFEQQRICRVFQNTWDSKLNATSNNSAGEIHLPITDMNFRSVSFRKSRNTEYVIVIAARPPRGPSGPVPGPGPGGALSSNHDGGNAAGRNPTQQQRMNMREGDVMILPKTQVKGKGSITTFRNMMSDTAGAGIQIKEHVFAAKTCTR